ncbi:hypothetical protein C8J56DRAFT_1016975 [Mycena floridula]|nr:hypothetical protein C8J56DRAFT_1016975 [Mycena floridula]
MQFVTLSSLVVAALALVAVGNPTPNEARAPTEDTSYLITDAQFREWLASKDPADITWIGEPINPLTRRSAQNTVVTFCSNRIDNLCGGPCTVYNGGATCLNAPDTNCLSATNNVGFCDRGGCGGSCNQFSSCGTRLDNNFCFTPGTQSILVGTA